MSDNFSLIIKNGSCYIDGKLTQTDIGLSGNKIKKIGKIELNSSKVYDATDKVVLPGIIDTQTHFREPGSTDVEDLESGSRAAVLGGVTSLFEMPNTNPPTSNLVEFDKKLQSSTKIESIVIMLFILVLPLKIQNNYQNLKMWRDVVELNYSLALQRENY